MAFADTAKLIVDLSLKGNFNAQLKSSERALGSFDAKLSRTEGRAYRAGQQIGTGIQNAARIAAVGVGFLASQVVIGLNSLAKLDDVLTQTNAVLKSTKNAAGQTAIGVRALAEQYERLNATISDEVIQSGENLLLTFTNIKKDAFEPALKAALDMNTALGRGEDGLTGTIQQLGVALNDPIRGLTRLQRAGITFTGTQKAQIETAIEAGDTFKAQGVILAELNKRYGGSFLAGGSTTTGKIAKFKDAIEDLQRALASALLPTLGKVADRLSAFLADPQVVKTIEGLGQSIADLFSDKNMAEGGKILGTLFDTAKAAAPVIKDAALATLSVVKAAVGLFTSLPKEVQQLAIGAFAINKITGGLVTNVAGGLISSVLKQLVSGVVNVQGAVVNVVGTGLPGVGGGAPLAPAGKGIIGQIVDVLPKIGIAAGFGVLTQQTIQAGVEQGVINADGHLNRERVFGEKPGKSLGLILTDALDKAGLGPLITKAGEKAALASRQLEATENRQGSAIVRSSNSVKDKLVDLQATQKTLLARGDTHAANEIQKLIDLKLAINALPAKINGILLLPGDSRSEGHAGLPSSKPSGDSRSEGQSPTLKTTVLVSPYGVGRATTTAALSGHLGSRAT